jgi:TRAP-type mannitol/chloroaromatic compound transport system permease small subunit
MQRFLSSIDNINDIVGRNVSFLIIVITGFTVFEVIARFAFSYPTMWTQQSTGFAVGIFVLLGGGFCLLHHDHITIDLIYSHLTTKRKAMVDLATSLLAFLFVGVLLVYSTIWAWESVQVRELSITVWGPPLYPIKVFVPIGSLLLFLQLIAKFIRDLRIVIVNERV